MLPLEQKQFRSSLRRGFLAWMTALMVAPTALILLNPHSVGAYLIAAVFLPGIFLAIRRKSSVQVESIEAETFSRWTKDGCPKVYTMPFVMPVLIRTVQPNIASESDVPEGDLVFLYRKILRSKLKFVAIMHGVLLILMPATSCLVTYAIQKPIRFDSLIIPIGVPMGSLVIAVIFICRESKSLSQFDDWVRSGCPKTITLERLKY